MKRIYIPCALAFFVTCLGCGGASTSNVALDAGAEAVQEYQQSEEAAQAEMEAQYANQAKAYRSGK